MHATVLEQAAHLNPHDTFNGFAIPDKLPPVESQPWWNNNGGYGTAWKPDWYQQALAEEGTTAWAAETHAAATVPADAYPAHNPSIVRPYVATGRVHVGGNAQVSPLTGPTVEIPIARPRETADGWDWRTDTRWPAGALAYPDMEEGDLRPLNDFATRKELLPADEASSAEEEQRTMRRAWLFLGASVLTTTAIITARYWDSISTFFQVRGR